MTISKPAHDPSESEPLPIGGGQVPDAWGVKRLENLITSLTGVLSARVVVTAQGEVTEIHVLTASDMQAKQVVRNIESALMAQLGLKIDHRKISVAQTADVREARKRHLMEIGGRKEIAMMVPVIFLILPVTILFALYPGLIQISTIVP